MSQVPVTGELLRWARERSGLTLAELVRRFPKYELWESDEAKPTLRQLERLAKVTSTPFGYFFLPTPPDDRLPIQDFRTVSDRPVRRPSPDLLETVQTMQRRQAWMREFLLENGLPPLEYAASVSVDDEPSSVSREMRRVLGVNRNWAQQHATWSDALRALRNAIEEIGILVAINGVVGNNTRRKLDPEEFRGFVLMDDRAPLVFVNGADAKAAQMFTLAHEVAHVWLGEEGVSDLPNLQPTGTRVEEFCNKVAAEFLVAQDEFRTAWVDVGHTEEPFQALARRFKVSPIVAARRALDLRAIASADFFEFYDEYQKGDRRRTSGRLSGGDFYANQDVRIGRRFAQSVVRAAREGRLLYRDAYELTGLHGKTFDRYAETLGFRIE